MHQSNLRFRRFLVPLWVILISMAGTSSLLLAQSDPTPLPTDESQTNPIENPTVTPEAVEPTLVLPTETATPTVVPTEPPTQLPPPTLLPTDVPSLTPVAITPTVAVPTEIIPASVTPGLDVSPTLPMVITATTPPTDAPTMLPPAIGLPFRDGFDNGVGWRPTGAWAYVDVDGARMWRAETVSRTSDSGLEFEVPVALTGVVRPQLVLRQKGILSSADLVLVEILPQSGSAWILVDQQPGTLVSPEWSSRFVDLTAWNNQTVRVRLRLLAMPAVPSGEQSQDYWLDEVVFQEYAASPTPALQASPSLLPTLIPTLIPSAAPLLLPSASPVALQPLTPTPERVIIQPEVVFMPQQQSAEALIASAGVQAMSAASTGTGLSATYFDNVNFTNLKVSRIDPTVNFNWGTGSPAPDVHGDSFSARWTGQVVPLYSETYRFYTISDSAVRLWVNGQQLINNWGGHYETEDSATISLVAGQSYDITLEFYENSGVATMILSWSSASQPRQVIPQSQLYPVASNGTPVPTTTVPVPTTTVPAPTATVPAPTATLTATRTPTTTVLAALTPTLTATRTPTATVLATLTPTLTTTVAPTSTPSTFTSLSTGTGTGLSALYFDNSNLTNLKVSRIDPTVNFSWGTGSPAPSVHGDSFSARWTGQVAPLYSETYRFYTSSDAGVRMWVNGQQLINNWGGHYLTEDSGTISLVAGQRYDITLEFYDNTGVATILLSWSSPSQPKQIIPQSRLFPVASNGTPVPTTTPSQSPTASRTPTMTPTLMASPSATRTPTMTPTLMASPSATRTPTMTPTASRTPTLMPTLMPTATVMPSLTPPPTGGLPETVYWGAMVNGLSPHPENMNPGGAFPRFESHAQKGMSILHWGQAWKNGSSYRNFYAPWFDAVRNHGSIPLIDWGSWDSARGAIQSEFQLSDIYNGNHDAYIRSWALGAKAWGHPFFLRFNWEMNGNWQFPWSEQINGNRPGDFVRAWRHVHDIFTANGVTNVTWVWCPNISSSITVPMANVYPGDDYVDWTCLDGYNKDSHWLSFRSVFSGYQASWLNNSYQEILNVAPNKPIMLGEFASLEAGDGGALKAQWILDAFLTQLPVNFPRIKAVVWFNWDDGNAANSFGIESSTASMAAFAQAIASSYYAPNRFSNINTSPIPPLR